MLGWSMTELAERAGVHRNTVYRLEHDGQSYSHAAQQIMRTMEDAGVEFTATGVRRTSK
jgi:transcriptional regulator with XRE-family HTH domain